ncbi:MAG: hypothetical protein WCZ86_15055 [Desulfurivibrionaceae bacterium]
MRELENMHITSDQSYRQLCEMAGVSVQSYMRWKERAQRGAEVVAAPGPKKVEPLDVAGLNEAIGQLAHGRKRTHGTGVLFQQYHDRISRRAFLSLVEETRQEFLHDRLAEQMRLEWRCPGLVWAIDGTKQHGRMIYGVRDLGSKYRAGSLRGETLLNEDGKMDGSKIAAGMETLFKRHGAPLFLKRDNEGILNDREVDAVLERYYVMPLNSPHEYPQYNGSMEQSQNEVQRHLKNLIGAEHTDREFMLAVDLTDHDLNHNPRRSNGGLTACEVFARRRDHLRKYNRRKRQEVYGQLKENAVRIVTKMQLNSINVQAAQTAWRIVVRAWLIENGLVKVKQKGKVSPYFLKFCSHN